MSQKRKIWTWSAVSALVLTSFVTACVKNGSKDNPIHKETITETQVTKISSKQIDGTESLTFTQNSEVAARHITKTYSFTIEEAMSLFVQRGEINNERCSGDEEFLQQFTLSGNNIAPVMIPKQKPTPLLQPGTYTLTVEMTNQALCKSISMDIVLQPHQSISQEDILREQKQSALGLPIQIIEEHPQLSAKTDEFKITFSRATEQSLEELPEVLFANLIYWDQDIEEYVALLETFKFIKKEDLGQGVIVLKEEQIAQKFLEAPTHMKDLKILISTSPNTKGAVHYIDLEDI